MNKPINQFRNNKINKIIYLDNNLKVIKNKSINQLRNNKINKITYLDNNLKVIKIMLNLKIRIIEIKLKIIYLDNNLKIIKIMLNLKIREIKLRIIKINRDNRIIFLIKNSLNKNKWLNYIQIKINLIIFKNNKHK